MPVYQEPIPQSWIQFQSSLAYRLIKRLGDVVITLALLPVLLPIGGVVAIIIRATMGGPVFFRQPRVGKNRRVFNMIKFRTMIVGAANEGLHTGEADARITPVGQMLRRLRLDELPQFWNILVGDMTLIGPRPEPVGLVEKYEKDIPHYHLRHAVTPGVTGLSQVLYGYTADLKDTIEKQKYDLYYIKHLSFWLDIRIVWLTIKTIFTGRGSR